MGETGREIQNFAPKYSFEYAVYNDECVVQGILLLTLERIFGTDHLLISAFRQLLRPHRRPSERHSRIITVGNFVFRGKREN